MMTMNTPALVDNKKFVSTLLEGASVFCAGMVSGSALYITLVEVPGRQHGGASAEYQLQNWHGVFPRAVYRGDATF